MFTIERLDNYDLKSESNETSRQTNEMEHYSFELEELKPIDDAVNYSQDFIEIKCLETYLNVSGAIYHLCLLCKTRIENIDNCLEHLQSHFKEEPYECHICSKSYLQFDELIIHINEVHNGTDSAPIKPTDNLLISDNVKSEVKLDNPIKSMSNNTRNNITTNQQFNTEYLCLYCKKSFTNPHERLTHLVDHLENQQIFKEIEEDVTDCDDSDKEPLDSNSNYDNEQYDNINDIDRDTEINDVDIVEINNDFSEILKEYQKQIKISASNSKPKSTSIANSKRNHICDTCGKGFTTQGNLQQHFIVHTKEKKFKCKICGKNYTSSSYLNKHIRIHQNVKPFTCDICNKKFRTTSGLACHQLQHGDKRPHQCNFCDRAFRTSESLKGHVRIHTGEKPFPCNICNGKFRTQHALKTHSILHTGEKPHKCVNCNKGFAQIAGLYNHMRRNICNLNNEEWLITDEDIKNNTITF